MSQAIPPAYSRFLGEQVRRILEANAEVSGPPPVTHESKQSATGGFAAPTG